MELRQKQRVSYATLFGDPSDEEEEAEDEDAAVAAVQQDQQPAGGRRKKVDKGKARAFTPESEDGSDVYEPEEASDVSEAAPSGVEDEDGDAGDGDGPASDGSGPPSASALRTPRQASGRARSLVSRVQRRTPSPPRNAPKRIPLARLAPALPGQSTSTHQAKYSTRLRATSLYFPPAPRRLVREPAPYGLDGWGEEMDTRCAGGRGVLRRLIHAGARTEGGPRWELLEERGWYREAKEGDMRPRVWESIRIPKSAVKLLNREEANAYLPTSPALNDTGVPLPPAPMTCLFGHFGAQKPRTLAMYDSFALKELMAESNSYIFNAGGPIHGLAWCPVHPSSLPLSSTSNPPNPDETMKHYVAVAPFTSSLDQPTVGQRSELGQVKACVQIWSLGREGMTCEMVLGVEEGPAWEIRWCPLPADDVAEQKGTVRKMGLLAGCFRSGHLSIYAVPHPDALKSTGGKAKGKGKEPLFVKLEPLFRLAVDDAGCYCLDWANSGLIAVGCTNGNIAVFDVGAILRDPSNRDPILRLPTHYYPAHQSCIRTAAWIRAPPQTPDGPQINGNPTMIASGGYDGQHVLSDTRGSEVAVLERMRDFVTSVAFSSFSGGPIFVEQDYRVKHTSVASINLGRGTTLMDATGPIWDLTTSDFHHNVAIASADGGVHIGTAGRPARKSPGANLVFTEYQMDYNRNTGEYRMLDNIKPREMRHVEEAYVVNKKKRRRTTKEASAAAEGSKPPAESGRNEEVTPSTGTWAPQIGAHRVAWCSGAGLARASMLVSGGASGLGRVDWVVGSWMKGGMPWNKIEVLRGEVEGMDDDSKDEDEDEQY